MIQNIELSPILLTKQMMSTNGKKMGLRIFIFDKYMRIFIFFYMKFLRFLFYRVMNAS